MATIQYQLLKRTELKQDLLVNGGAMNILQCPKDSLLLRMAILTELTELLKVFPG